MIIREDSPLSFHVVPGFPEIRCLCWRLRDAGLRCPLRNNCFGELRTLVRHAHRSLLSHDQHTFSHEPTDSHFTSQPETHL
ncbi:uncharacterized protein LAJ45_00035 [Morchella importuna]|uniref:uncharacterized protein n=1 Tax=Morchella importuna TaxID=1174673 RepID=UPI001E8CF6A4|nr:uncharacterized protein LAJ45_00035 [Morchella importuna]KAH8155027.1 hypothetical protein LAJ45_00035 [Morchella importuna]